MLLPALGLTLSSSAFYFTTSILSQHEEIPASLAVASQAVTLALAAFIARKFTDHLVDPFPPSPTSAYLSRSALICLGQAILALAFYYGQYSSFITMPYSAWTFLRCTTFLPLLMDARSKSFLSISIPCALLSVFFFTSSTGNILSADNFFLNARRGCIAYLGFFAEQILIYNRSGSINNIGVTLTEIFRSNVLVVVLACILGATDGSFRDQIPPTVYFAFLLCLLFGLIGLIQSAALHLCLLRRDRSEVITMSAYQPLVFLGIVLLTTGQYSNLTPMAYLGLAYMLFSMLITTFSPLKYSTTDFHTLADTPSYVPPPTATDSRSSSKLSSPSSIPLLLTLFSLPLVCTAYLYRPQAVARARLMVNPLFNTAVEGNSWSIQLFDSMKPKCTKELPETELWTGTTRTVLASYPRSGNTRTRALVERSTGYQTTTVHYCDRELLETFKGECVHNNGFLIKDHWPWYKNENATYYKQYDRVVHLIRNPIDAIFSEWSLRKAPKLENKHLNHTAHFNGILGGPDHDILLLYRDVWLHHATYWANTPLPTHFMRYEDLVEAPLSTLMSLLRFLLRGALPDLGQVACALELNEAIAPYKSSKRPIFDAWDNWEPSLRYEIIESVKDVWCKFEYDVELRHARSDIPKAIDEICQY